MEKPKRTMKKDDVQAEIAGYVKKKYNQLDVVGREKPISIQRVLATIQDTEYHGAGNYSVLLELSGTIILENGDSQENIQYQTTCQVSVAESDEGEPNPQIDGQIILTKV